MKQSSCALVQLSSTPFTRNEHQRKRFGLSLIAAKLISQFDVEFCAQFYPKADLSVFC